MKNLNQLKAGTILSYVNLLISCIIPLLYTPVMLDILGQAEYGLYSLANSVISYLSLLNFGMGVAIIRYITMYRAESKTEEVRRILGLFVVIYSCLSVLVCVGGVVLIQLSGSVFGKGLEPDEITRIRKLLVVMTVNTAIAFPLGIFSSAVIAYERYFFNKIICLVETIAAPVLNLIILYAGHGSLGMTMGGLGVTVANGLIYGCYCIKKIGVYPAFRKMPVFLLKELAVFCAFVFLSSIVDMLYWATDKVLIGAVIGSAAVAVYNVGGTFTAMLQNMAHAISGVFGPRVNMMIAKDTPKKEISELLIRVGRLQYLIISLILSGYIVFGKTFLRLWVGEDYDQAYYIALLTMVPLAVPLIQNIAFTTIVAENKHRFRSIVYAVIAVFNVISTYLVLPYYGIVGAAVCTAAAFVLGQGIIMNIYYYRVTELDIPAFWGSIGKMSLVPGAMIIVGGILVKFVLTMTTLWWFLAWVMAYTMMFGVLSWTVTMNPYEKNLFVSLAKKPLEAIKKKRFDKQ